MGMDIFGLNPKSEFGKYFRNNIWWWRPMSMLIHETCKSVLTKEQLSSLAYNDGTEYSDATANMIARRLELCVDSNIHGKIIRQCRRLSGCEAKSYPYAKQNILNFCKFCRQSGGFSIC